MTVLKIALTVLGTVGLTAGTVLAVAEPTPSELPQAAAKSCSACAGKACGTAKCAAGASACAKTAGVTAAASAKACSAGACSAACDKTAACCVQEPVAACVGAKCHDAKAAACAGGSCEEPAAAMPLAAHVFQAAAQTVVGFLDDAADSAKCSGIADLRQCEAVSADRNDAACRAADACEAGACKRRLTLAIGISTDGPVIRLTSGANETACPGGVCTAAGPTWAAGACPAAACEKTAKVAACATGKAACEAGACEASVCEGGVCQASACGAEKANGCGAAVAATACEAKPACAEAACPVATCPAASCPAAACPGEACDAAACECPSCPAAGCKSCATAEDGLVSIADSESPDEPAPQGDSIAACDCADCCCESCECTTRVDCPPGTLCPTATRLRETLAPAGIRYRFAFTRPAEAAPPEDGFEEEFRNYDSYRSAAIADPGHVAPGRVRLTDIPRFRFVPAAPEFLPPANMLFTSFAAPAAAPIAGTAPASHAKPRHPFEGTWTRTVGPYAVSFTFEHGRLSGTSRTRDAENSEIRFSGVCSATPDGQLYGVIDEATVTSSDKTDEDLECQAVALRLVDQPFAIRCRADGESLIVLDIHCGGLSPQVEDKNPVSGDLFGTVLVFGCGRFERGE